MIVAPGSSASTGSARIGEQLVAPDDPALAVDRADPVAVAVEGDAEIELFVATSRLRSARFASSGRIGMVVGEAAVDLGVEQLMLARQPRASFSSTGPAGAVAGVPADPEGAAVEVLRAAGRHSGP